MSDHDINDKGLHRRNGRGKHARLGVEDDEPAPQRGAAAAAVRAAWAARAAAESATAVAPTGAVPVAGNGLSGEEQRVALWEETARALAEQNGGVIPTFRDPLFDETRRHVRLADSKLPPPSASDTETLLNNLIEDCHFLIRELAFHSARLTPDEGARLRFLASAGTLAEQGAKVGGVIAGLRGSPIVEERRQRMIVEHVQRVAAPKGEGGSR